MLWQEFAVQTKFVAVLDLLLSGLEWLSIRDCCLMLLGLRQCESEREASQLLMRMERRQWIKREGRGAQARFAVTATGARQSTVLEPARHWNATWDGKWRIFTYDLPEQRRADRVRLWRALHAHKLGLLQRSVWVWPHDVEPILHGILQATGIPECFCGFVGERLFLCSDTELVRTAWDFEQIGASHREYLQDSPRLLEILHTAPDLQGIAAAAGQERLSYEKAFSIDPCLPRRLWPKSYRGHTVDQRHTKFRSQLRNRIRAVAEI